MEEGGGRHRGSRMMVVNYGPTLVRPPLLLPVSCNHRRKLRSLSQLCIGQQDYKKEHVVWDQTTWVQILTVPHTRYVIVWKVLNLSELSFPICKISVIRIKWNSKGQMCSTPEFPLRSVSRAHTLYHSAVLPPKQCAQSQMLISVAETGFSARSVLLKIKAYAHFLFFAVTPGVTHLGPTFHDQDISSFSSAFFPVSRLSGSLCLFTTILTILQIDKFNFHPFFMIS